MRVPSFDIIRRVALVGVVSGVAVSSCGWGEPSAGVAVVVPTSPAPGESSVDVALEVSGDSAVPTGSEPPSTLGPGAPGVTSSPRPADVDLPESVAVVGDSLTLSATEEITAALAGVGIDVLAVDGAQNRRMTHGADPAPGLSEIDDIAAVADPELWVIALGTNDVGSEATSEQFRADVGTILDAIPDGAAVVWVDLWIRDRQPAIERANRDLREVVGLRRRTIVADWFSHGDDHGIVTDDGVHLTDDGQHVFATTIVDAVYDLFARQ